MNNTMDTMGTDPLTSTIDGTNDILLFYLNKAANYIKKSQDNYLVKKEDAKVRHEELLRVNTLNNELMQKIESLTKQNQQLKYNFEMRSPPKYRRRKSHITDQSDISSSPSSIPSSDTENQNNSNYLHELNDNIVNMTTMDSHNVIKAEVLSPTIKYKQTDNIRLNLSKPKFSPRRNLTFSPVVIPETEIFSSLTPETKKTGNLTVPLCNEKSSWVSKTTSKKGKISPFLSLITPKSSAVLKKDKIIRSLTNNKLLKQQTLTQSFCRVNDSPLHRDTEYDSNLTYCEDLEFLSGRSKCSKPSNGNKTSVNDTVIRSQLLHTAQEMASKTGADDCSIVEELLQVVKQENEKTDSRKKLDRKMENPDFLSNSTTYSDSVIFIDNSPFRAISINTTVDNTYEFDTNNDSINILEKKVLQQAATPLLDFSPIQKQPEKFKNNCRDCEKTYNFYSINKTPEEVALMDSRCFYHKRIQRAPTPEGFWDHKFSDTQK